MLEVHPPHTAAHSWKDFFIHIATITIGLLIAVALEQTVEYLHHRHQRRQLVDDLQTEVGRNREVILGDLKLEGQEQWFVAAQERADHEVLHDGKLSFTIPAPPCGPGQVHGYLGPTSSVWSTARDSNLVYLLPVDEARMYDRLIHNLDTLGHSRDNLAQTCEHLYALRMRFAQPSADGSNESWSLTHEQAQQFAEAAAAGNAAMMALIRRLRISLRFVDAILSGDYLGQDGNPDETLRQLGNPDTAERKTQP